MELGIETTVEGNIIEKGVIALDAKIFSDIVRKLPDNDVHQAKQPLIHYHLFQITHHSSI